VPNARQQDLVPEIRNALLQVINVGSCKLDHGVVCSSDPANRAPARLTGPPLARQYAS
jgi:hypothetical protein